MIDSVIKNYEEPRYIINENDFIIGKDEKMLQIFYLINLLADTSTTTLITGLSGTGKELVAKALHYNSKKEGDFVPVNCAAIPEGLAESILFGHLRGSFTHAYFDKKGLVASAERGTLFLDEITSLTPYLQTKILRLIQEKEYLPVGCSKTRKADVRIIAATNKDPREELKKGNFRGDLFYRLNTVPIKIPELKERKGDIPLIADYFIEKFNDEKNARINGLSDDAKDKLLAYDWPGNVRELENVIERAFLIRREEQIQKDEIFINPEEILPEIGLRIREEKIKGEDPQIIDSGQKNKKWYDDYVLPMFVEDINKFKGTKSRTTLDNYAEKGTFYTEFVGRDKFKSRIIFLTPMNLFHIFKRIPEDYESYGYKELEKRIKESNFTEIARKPFKIYSIPSLAYKFGIGLYGEGYSKYGAEIKEAVEAQGVHIISNRRTLYFVLTEDTAKYFVPSWCDKREEKIELLKSEIRENYKRFQQWKPGIVYKNA